MPGFDARRALKRGWWLVVTALLVGEGTAFWVTAGQTRIYSSEASVVVVPSTEAGSGGDLIRSLETLERRTIVATFARLPGSSEIKEDVARELGETVKELRSYHIRGSVVPNTNLIRIEVTGADPERAAAIANATVAALHSSARRLYRIYTVRPFSLAEARRSPIYPNPQRNLLMGGILSLFVGLAAALLGDALRSPAREKE